MYRFLFFVIQCYLLVENAAADDIKTMEEKYIDMLPEGDKLAFLAKVARRIRGEVQSDVTPETSDLIVNEKQLNAQSEYVHKILNEEVETHSKNPQRPGKLDNEETTEASKDDHNSYREAQNALETTTNSEEGQTDLTTTDDLDVSASTIKQDLNENGDYKKTNKRKRSYSNEGKKSGTKFNMENESIITASSQDINNYTHLETAAETISIKTDLLEMLETLTTIKPTVTNDSQTPKEQIDTPLRLAEVSQKMTIENEKEDIKLNGFSVLVGQPLESNGSKILRSEHENLNENKGGEDNNYHVYEIDPAKEIFQKVVEVEAPQHNNQQDIAVEEPHYVPVYNYGESKAFYNAHNRLGPNADKETVPEEHFEDSESKFLRDDRDPYSLNLDYGIDVPGLNDDGVSIARIPEDVKKNTVKRTAKNFDFDYYFGRNSDNSGIVNDGSVETWGDTFKKKINKARVKYAHKNRANYEVESEKKPSYDDVGDGGEKVSLTKLNTDGDEDLEAYIVVANDMITTNNEELRTYDWLGTTVDILSAIEKLTEVIKHERNGVKLQRRDEQLLRYIEYLHETAISKEPAIQDGGSMVNQNGGREADDSDSLPKFLRDIAKMYAEVSPSSSDHRGDEVPQKWLKVNEEYGSEVESTNYGKGEKRDDYRLEKLILKLTKELSPLYSAISDIAASAAYDNQNWFGNLRNTYLKDTDREKSIKVLLHIMACELLDQIEESAGNGVEDDFQKYITTRRGDVDRSVEQFRLVLKLLNLLNS